MDKPDRTRAADLPALFRGKRGRLGVIGLGYVGLPICLAATRAGLGVIGFDIDATKPEALHRGESYLRHIEGDAVRAAVATGRFRATNDFTQLKDADALLICVPTPLTSHLDPDLRFVIQTAETISKVLRAGQIVILESTTYPGTTSDVVRPILERSGLKVGRDVLLAFSPEREDPGNARFSSATIPKVVGADDELSLAGVVAVVHAFVERTVPVSSSRAAEGGQADRKHNPRPEHSPSSKSLSSSTNPWGVDLWEGD